MSGAEPCIWKRLTLMLKHSWGLRESSFSLCLPGCCSFRDNVPGYCRKQEQAPGEQARSAAQLSCIPLMNPPSGWPLDSSLDSLGCGYAVFCRYNRGSRYPRIRKQKKEERSRKRGGTRTGCEESHLPRWAVRDVRCRERMLAKQKREPKRWTEVHGRS